jgi:hypothetical protein
MKTMFKVLMSVVALSALSACGVGVEHDDQYTNQQQKDNDALTEQYAHAVGSYEGTLVSTTPGVAPQKGHMYLFITQLDAGSNPDGSRKSQATLMGRFQLDNVVANSDYTTLIANYDAFSGRISLSQSGSATVSNPGAPTSGTPSGTLSPDATTIEGSVMSDAADLVVKKGGRDWGRFTAGRTSTVVTAPASNDDVDRRERLFAVYREIEGTYSATIDSGSQRLPVILTISVNEVVSPTPGVVIPVLVAQYRRADISPGIGEYQMSVSYDQLSGRIAMTATAGGGPSVPGSAYLSASGTWLSGNLDVVFRNRTGYMGELKAKRKPYRP